MTGWLPALAAGLVGLVPSTPAALVGEWLFDQPANLTNAAVGPNLVLSGTASAAGGFVTNDGAIRIGVGSYLRCTHGIPGNGGGSYVNEFSLLFDFLFPAASSNQWGCLYQTNQGNSNDGELFIRNSNRTLGVSATGYSTQSIAHDTWYRVAVSVKNGSWYRLYVDGVLWLEGVAQLVDGRFSLDPDVLFAADENGEDAEILFSRIRVYDHALSAAEAAALGGPSNPDASNRPPAMLTATGNPAVVATGSPATFRFAAADPDLDQVRVQVDWGDGLTSPWSAFAGASQLVELAHTYAAPGAFALRAMAQDEHGAVSAWHDMGPVTATGAVTLAMTTPPYLQNMSPTSMVVLCEIPQAIPLRLEYGRTAAYGRAVDFQPEPTGNATWFCRALVTGLEPQRDYHYRLTLTNGAPVSTDATFRTATTNAVAFSFGVWSDSQTGNGGDWTADPLEPSRSMMRHMAASGVAFGLGCGDLAQNGASYSDTRSYYLDRIARELGPAAPWYVAWGNHDTGATSAPVRRASDMPSRFRPGFSPGHGSYAFTYANCLFVCLDDYYQAEITNGWLEAVLGSPEAQAARFRLVAIHTPPFCERWIDGSASLRSRLVPLLEQYGVRVCFSGHTHEYERGATNGVHYVVTGGSSYLDYPEAIVAEWPHMTVGGSHNLPGMKRRQSAPGVLGPAEPIVGGLVHEYVFVQIRGAYLRAECRAFNADGSFIGVLDSFEIGTDPATDSDGDGLPDAWETESLVHLGYGPADDPDGDGLSNLEEWAFGSHPNQGADAARPEFFRVTTAPGTSFAAVRFRRNLSAPGLGYRVRGSPDVMTGPWADCRELVAPTEPAGGVFEVLSIRDGTPLELGPSRFLMLEVAPAGP